MKAIKSILTLLIITILASSCNKDFDDLTQNVILIDTTVTDTIDKKLWVLTHKSYESPGIYLYNETTATIELELDLPKNLESPHALAFDGTSLWVGGNGENESIYQLNSGTGQIISEIRNIQTEGIALLDEYLYYSNNKMINKIEKTGTLIEEIATQNSSYNIPDIAISGNDLYYLRYSENEPVIKLSLSNKRESTIPITESTGTYCLTIYNNEIITINPFNEIIRFDQRSGVFISNQPTIIKGWITAIAPFYEELN